MITSYMKEEIKVFEIQTKKDHIFWLVQSKMTSSGTSVRWGCLLVWAGVYYSWTPWLSGVGSLLKGPQKSRFHIFSMNTTL